MYQLSPHKYVKNKTIKQLIEDLFQVRLNQDICEVVSMIRDEDSYIMNYRWICVRRLKQVIRHLLDDDTLELSIFGSCCTGNYS